MCAVLYVLLAMCVFALMANALYTCRATREASRLTSVLRGLLRRAAASPWQCRCSYTGIQLYLFSHAT